MIWNRFLLLALLLATSTLSSVVTAKVNIAFRIALASGAQLPKRTEENAFERVVDYSLKRYHDERSDWEYTFPSSISERPDNSDIQMILNSNQFSTEVINAEGISLSINTDKDGGDTWSNIVVDSDGNTQLAEDMEEEDLKRRLASELALPVPEARGQRNLQSCTGICVNLCKTTGQAYWCSCCGPCCNGRRRTRNLRTLFVPAETDEHLQAAADRIKEIALEELMRWHHKMASFEHANGYILEVVLQSDEVGATKLMSTGTFGKKIAETKADDKKKEKQVKKVKMEKKEKESSESSEESNED